MKNIICKVKSCNKPSRTKQLCDMHYTRTYRYGQLEIPFSEVEEYAQNGAYKCQSCSLFKDRLDFSSDKSTKYGVCAYCKQCHSKKQKKSYSENKTRHKNSSLKSRFGITLKQYNVLLSKQNFRCAICLRSEIDNGKSLAVDHNHTTGAIRGLLCIKCNFGIGQFEDNTELLKKTIRYLGD